MTTSYHAKEVAVFVRQELKTAFPGQKFSVRSESRTVRVQWTDGPSTDEVSAITNQFSGMHFDGMQDMDEYSDCIYKGEKVSFYCYKPTLKHHYSMDTFRPAVEHIARKYAIWSDVNLDELRYKDCDYHGVYIHNAPTDVTNCCYRNLDGETRDYLSSISFYDAPTPKAKATSAPAQTIATTENQSITVTENDERDGVEVRFESKPEQEIIELLKAADFRWSRFNGCWYAKRNAETLAFANGLLAQAEPAQTEVLAIAPAKATPAPVHNTPALALVGARYTVVEEALTYAPVVFSARSPQQELKDKLTALDVDSLSAEQISLLLKAIG